jgi:glucan phosphoethanolaminetransferase (alkaline phosphatase superfamily)
VCLLDAGILPGRDRGFDKIALCSLSASILWLTLAHTCISRPWILHAILAPFYLSVGVDLFLNVQYRSRLTAGMLVMFLENWDNARDYFHDQFKELLLAAILLTAFYALGLRGIRNIRMKRRRYAPILAGVALIALYGTVVARQSRGTSLAAGLNDTVIHERSSPFGVLCQAHVARQIYLDSKRFRDVTASFRFGATRPSIPDGPEVYVLVLGEGSRPDHWGLYGYERNTTPLLARKSNLVIMRDAIAAASLTQISVPFILTRKSIQDPSSHSNEKSVVALANEVGFKTYWFSTQARDSFTGAINRYSSDAHVSRFFDRERDIVLLEAVKKAVRADPSGKHFFFLHTLGSHSVYEDRYPSAFAQFPQGATVSGHDRLVNTYDNTILYTDFVLSQLIDFLGEQQGSAGLFYVSDHGENLEDDSRRLKGHFFNNRFDLPIAMFIWYSNAFATQYPDRVVALASNSQRRINTRVAFHTLADMMAVVLDDPDLHRLSLLSSSFVEPKREVFHNWDANNRIVTVDYDVSVEK